MSFRSPFFFIFFGFFAGAADRAGAADAISLERAYDRTLATDQSIRTAYYEVRKANLLPWSALTRLAPSVSASPGISQSTSTTSDIVTSVNGVTTTTTGLGSVTTRSGAANLDFTLTQTLIDLSVFPAFRLGKLTARAAQLARQYTIRQTLYGVTTAYFEVLKQERLVVVNKETLDLGQQQLDLAEKRAEVGEVTRTDVLRARVTVESSRRAWIEASNTLELDRNTLRNILNLKPDAELAVIEPPAYPTDLPPFETMLRRANHSREDLLVKEIAVQQDVERKNEVLAEYAPQVAASATSGFNRLSGSSRSHQNNWEVQLGVNVPFFTGGQREIDLMTAKYQIEETRLARDTALKQVEADVKGAWLDVKTLEETLTALRVQVAAAEQSYRDLQTQYSAGAATSVDVLSALIDLDTSRKDLAVQIYQYEVALRNLEEVTGTFQEERVKKAPDSMMRWILILLGVVALGGGWWHWSHRGPAEVQYETAVVTKGEMTQIVTATGTLNPVTNVQVGSQISGNIMKLNADFNSAVKKDEIVAELDPVIYLAIVNQCKGDLASSKAALELAQLTAKRKMDLVAQHAAAQADLDTAIANLHQAEAAVEIKEANLQKAQGDLDHCSVHSPIDGTVISRAVDVGQTVAAAMNAPVLFTIAADLTKMQIDSAVAEADVGNVEVGQPVDFTVDAFPYRTFHGTVTQVRNAATTVQNVVTYDVVISVANEDLKLKPGMTTNLSIVVAQREGVLKLPNGGLRFRPPDAPLSETRMTSPGPGGSGRPGGPGEHHAGGGPKAERTIYVLKTGAAKPVGVPVKLGITDGIATEVISGLAEGDRVVTGIVPTAGESGAPKSTNPLGGGPPRFR